MNAENQNKDKLELALERYEREQREFENHWLWKELGTTPKRFFAMVNEQVQKSGVDPKVWENKLNEAKKALETRLKEKQKRYTAVNFGAMKALRV